MMPIPTSIRSRLIASSCSSSSSAFWLSTAPHSFNRRECWPVSNVQRTLRSFPSRPNGWTDRNRNQPNQHSLSSQLDTLPSTAGVPDSRSKRFLSSVSTTASFSTAARVASTTAGPFPSLLLGAGGAITAMGSFAEAQKIFLQPDEESVTRLTRLLHTTRTGIVAHYYMDVELQGILSAAAANTTSTGQPQALVGIADSLKMGDMAVQMAQSGAVDQIICLGVDFMAESVASILSKQGYDVPVYRADARKIGCSLAESAEHDAYRAWLHSSREAHPTCLHVVYINTSLETKAVSNAIVPTITCTSSNVLQTILQAAAQMPDVQILYGPDTYMGHNLVTLLAALEQTSDAHIQALHPRHDRASVARLRQSLHVYASGHCVVHQMFGAHVVETVTASYPHAYVTAHLEVPGEMFDIAMRHSLSDRGVVGSTSDILHFIARKVRDAASKESVTSLQTLQFILGTEAGMVTSIVSSVQAILRETGNQLVQAEIIFPVASEAVMVTNDTSSSQPLALVPGVGGGEGCSTAGGCATCPFMKMNNIDSLHRVLELIEQQRRNATADANGLSRHLPPDRLTGKMIDGRSALELGTEPIMYMREFNQTKRIPDDLVQRVLKTAP